MKFMVFFTCVLIGSCLWSSGSSLPVFWEVIVCEVQGLLYLWCWEVVVCEVQGLLYLWCWEVVVCEVQGLLYLCFGR